MGMKIGSRLCVILLVCSIALLVYAYLSINDLKLSLNETTVALERTKTELQNVKGDMARAASQSEKANSEASAAKNELLQTKIELSKKESQFTSELLALRKVAEENKFFFYYDWLVAQQYDVGYLKSVIQGLKWMQSYAKNFFDCSEMSACLERELENKGFHTKIVVGKTPFPGGGYHAWLLVEVKASWLNGKYIPVEATNMSVVDWQNLDLYPYFNNYFKYDFQFETIHDVLQLFPTEFDWWAY